MDRKPKPRYSRMSAIGAKRTLGWSGTNGRFGGKADIVAALIKLVMIPEIRRIGW